MDRTTLSEIALEQYQELQASQSGVRRERLDDILPLLDLPHVLAITGMRRCGKSTLMRQALKQALAIDQIYELELQYGLIISLDHTEEIKFEGKMIQVVPIVDWLLSYNKAKPSGYK